MCCGGSWPGPGAPAPSMTRSGTMCPRERQWSSSRQQQRGAPRRQQHQAAQVTGENSKLQPVQMADGKRHVVSFCRLLLKKHCPSESSTANDMCRRSGEEYSNWLVSCVHQNKPTLFISNQDNRLLCLTPRGFVFSV